MKVKIIKEFFEECDCWSNSYSSVVIVNSTLEKAIEAAKEICGERAEDYLNNGILYENGVITFDVYKAYTKGIARELSLLLDNAIVYADTSWDSHEFYCYKNGKEYDGYTAKWEKEEPIGYPEDDDDESAELYYDCDVIIKDNLTGTEWFVGGGMCEQDAFDMYKEIVERNIISRNRLFVDMDGVLCEFNKDASIEEVATKGYFTKCIPQESVVKAIFWLLNESDADIYILSSVFSDNHSIADKNQWLDDNGLFGISRNRRLFVPYGTSKAEFLKENVGVGEHDFLLDDFSKNLHEWHGVGIKLYNGINGTKGTWTGYSVNSRSSDIVITNTIKGIMQYAKVA